MISINGKEWKEIKNVIDSTLFDVMNVQRVQTKNAELLSRLKKDNNFRCLKEFGHKNIIRAKLFKDGHVEIEGLSVSFKYYGLNTVVLRSKSKKIPVPEDYIEYLTSYNDIVYITNMLNSILGRYTIN